MLRTLQSLLIVGAAFAGGLVAGSAVIRQAHARGANPYQGLDTLARALTTIEDHYVEPVDGLGLTYDAVRGMVQGLDSHSLFLDPDENRQLQTRTEGHFFGVGVEISKTEGGFYVHRVIDGGPAARAGVAGGDVIVTVDGQPTADLDIDALGDLLSGAQGTSVALDLRRDDALIQATVWRDHVFELAVHGALFAPGWAYARVEHFYHRRVAEELEETLASLEAESGRPLQGVVLDLRRNPGGLLDEAVQMVDQFVSEGLIVETRGRDGQRLEHHDATSAPTDRTVPLVVLVDGGSASASEIVAGALHDMGRAKLVGAHTYGKGSLQRVYEFEDGSAIKLTVARYHLPNGETIADHEGIVPDVEVEFTSGDPVADLRAAVDSLALPADQRAGIESRIDALALPEPVEPALPVDGPMALRLEQDPQLEAAWQTIRGER